MKRILNYSVLAFFLFFITSCDKGLGELNRNQTNPIAIDPLFQLNNAVINLAPTSGSLVYDLGVVQQIVTPNGGVIAGANYNVDNRNYFGPIWQTYYRNVIRNTKDIINSTKDNGGRSNLMNMARIVQAHAFMVLTDSHGDIPYFEAGFGYLEQTFLPKYDAQEAIYADIIKELTEASAALNASGRIETGDVLYGGNISQWKKYGYSLLLRAGMRLSEVDPNRAQSITQTAFNGGVIINNADNALIRHDANFRQPLGITLNATEGANFFLSRPFVNYLKSTNDPRLSSIAIRYVGAKSGAEQLPAIGSTDPSKQIGMPIGYDNGTIEPVYKAEGLVSFYEYSQVDRRRLAKQTAPSFLVTAAQTNLLLAEAAHRGWITTGSAEDYYKAGVRAHMEQMASYDPASAIGNDAIQAYLAANPFNSARALEQINTQYWIASFLNGPEVWANFRRSGFPALTPNTYDGDIPAGTFINRLTYPISELSANTTNVNEAIQQQGPDVLSTKVWWDK